MSLLACDFLSFFFLIIRRPPRSTRTDTLLPYTTLFRSLGGGGERLFSSGPPPQLAPARFLQSRPVLSACDRPASRARPPAQTRWHCPAAPPITDHHHPIPVADRAGAMQHYTLTLDRFIDHAAKWRSAEHTSELQSLMTNSYAVFCLKQNN